MPKTERRISKVVKAEKAKPTYTLAKSFALVDLLIAFGVGAIVGGTIGIVGTVVGVVCVFAGWAVTKVFKKEVKKDAN